MQNPAEARFERVSLGSNVTLHLAPDPKFKTATVKLFLRSDLEAGRASELALLPSLLRRGTRALPSQRELTKHLEALYGTQLGGDILKIGEQQVISFKLDVAGDFFLPRGARAFERALLLLRDLVLDPALDPGGDFPEAVVAQEKVKQKQFIASLLNDKGAYAAERCGRTMCQGEPYEVYEYGDAAELDRTTPAALTATWRDLVARAPLDVFVLGAFDPAEARAIGTRAFTRPSKDARPLRGTTRNPPRRERREVREAMPVRQGKLCIGLRSETRIEDRLYFSLVAMNGILGSFAHSKLFRNVREKAGLCYDASSSLERTKGLIFIQCGIEKENFEKARDLALEQLEAIRRGEVTDEEMSSTRSAMRLGYRSLRDRPAQLANSVYILALGGRPETLDEVAARVEGATREEIVEAARGIWLDTVYFLEPDGTAADEEPAALAEEQA